MISGYFFFNFSDKIFGRTKKVQLSLQPLWEGYGGEGERFYEFLKFFFGFRLADWGIPRIFAARSLFWRVLAQGFPRVFSVSTPTAGWAHDRFFGTLAPRREVFFTGRMFL